MRFGTILLPVALLLAALPVAASGAPASTGDSVKPAAFQLGDCDFSRAKVAGDKRGVSPNAANPLTNEQWYVDPEEPAYTSLQQYKKAGQTSEAEEMAKIALTPRFKWFGKFTPAPRRACAFIAQAQAAGQVPLIATLRHQGKECNSRYTAGGVAEDNATKKWFDDMAAGIKDSRVVIAFEPDSVGTIPCLAASRRAARVAVLRHGIDVLSKLPNATIYIEATASDWKSVSYTTRYLKAIGVSKVRGFMLNVTHYDWTGNNIRYGKAVSRRLGGKHFIISTAMNGRGPVHYQRGKRRINVFCHPLYRGAGPYPSTKTADPLVDAYMWINRDGYSGGSCNGGPLPVGTWWPARALMFGRYQSQALLPAKGSAFGFPRGRYSIRNVAGDQYKP